MIIDNDNNFEAALSYHSHSQYILYPWGWGNVESSKENLLNALGNEMSDFIYNVDGVRYTVGRTADILYPCTGDLTDWVLEEKSIPAFTIELRPHKYYHWY